MKSFAAFAALAASLVACPKQPAPFVYAQPDADASYNVSAEASLPSPDTTVGGNCAAYCAHLRAFPSCVVEVRGGLACEDLCAQSVADGADLEFACVLAATTPSAAYACCQGKAGCSSSCAP
jgi:hypothetical protein